MNKFKSNKLTNLYSAQFKALFHKDILVVIQGSLPYFIVRMLLPTICFLVIFALVNVKNYDEFTGIPETRDLLQYSLPSCLYLRDNSGGNYGSKFTNDNCVSLGYYPSNEYTDKIMKQASTTFDRRMGKDIVGYQDQEQIDDLKFKPMYVVEFANPNTHQNFKEYLHNLSVLIYYNATLINNPNFLNMYGEEPITKSLSFSFLVKINPASAHPTIIQAHISSAISSFHDIIYKPYIRQNPYVSEEGQPVLPQSYITLPLIILPILFQYMFVFLHLSSEKNQGILDSLRLSGVSDFIYHSETVVFQFGIFIIQIVNMMFIMYGFPMQYDFFQFIDPGIMLLNLLTGGLYATCVAMFFNIITTQKTGITVMIVVFALFVCALLLFLLMGSTILFDPSFLPGVVQVIISIFWPFITTIYTMGASIQLNRPKISIDYQSLQYSIIKDEKMSFTQYFEKRENYKCAFEQQCEFTLPATGFVAFITFLETIAYFFGTWILGEWIPINSSACRPPWKLFTKHVLNIDNEGFTMGLLQQQKRQKFKAKVENNKKIRTKLSDDMINKCLSEATQKCDHYVIEQTRSILNSDQSSNEILVTHHLHKTFKRSCYHKQRLLQGEDHLAVQSVTMRVHKGEIYGIAGHNGAGKSTTLGLITGAVRSDKPGFKLFANNEMSKKLVNNAWIEQFNIRDDMHYIRRNLGYCPQFNTNVYQDLTVFQNLKFQCSVQNIPYYDHNKIAKMLLMKVGLWEWRNKKLKQLSGGMQRRISIAMSMVNTKTKLIILDEPSTGLDPQTKRVLWKLIKETARKPRKTPVIIGNSIDNVKVKRVRQERPGVIITSHDMNELNTICDTVNIMSSGQIVALGTALELKKKFGTGYSLTIICKSTQDRELFYQQFQENIINNSNVVKLVDQSGCVIQYSISDQEESKIQTILKYIEDLLTTSFLVDDFSLEQTSMDEVFVTVGKMFELANGGEQELEKCDKQQVVIPEVNNADIEQISTVELTSDSEIDEQINGGKSQQNKLTQEQINRILTPKRGRPAIFRALLYKMASNDQLSRSGIVVLVLLPVIFLIIALIIGDVFIPFLIGEFSKSIYKLVDGLDEICSQCNILRIMNLQVPECEGFDSWGFGNLCEEVKIFGNQTISPPPVWYGGDIRAFPNSTNLYNSQEESVKLYIFDKKQILGANNQPNIFAYYQQGQRQLLQETININQTSVTLSKEYFYYQNSQGQLLNHKIQQQQSQLIYNTLLQQQSILDNFPSKPIAVQDISLQSKQYLNSFTIKSDIQLLDAYNYFGDSVELDNLYLKYLRTQNLPLDNLKLPLNNTDSNYSDKVAEIQQELTDNPSPWDVKGQRIFVSMDDLVNIQHLKQQLAQKLPIGYINLDTDYQQELEHNNPGKLVYAPFISGFLPARTLFNFYQAYSYSVIWVPTDNFNSIKNVLIQQNMSKNLVESLFKMQISFQLTPSPVPSIIRTIDLSSFQVSPQTSIIDINARLQNAILKQKVDNKINIRYGVQAMPHEVYSVIDTASMSTSFGMAAIFATIGGYYCMIKFGSHIVTDRQTGMRRSLFLNGVKSSTYWFSSFVYSILLTTLIQILMVIFGTFILRLKVYQTMDFGVVILLSILVILSSVGMSLFVASFFSKTSYFIAVTLIIIIISAISIVFNMGSGDLGFEPQPYAWILPSIAFTQLIVQCSYQGVSVKQLFQAQFGYLYIWSVAESVIFMFCAYYFDQVLPLNGYKAQHWLFCCRCKNNKQIDQQKQFEVVQHKILENNIQGHAIGEDVATSDTQTQVYENKILFNNIDNLHEISVKTARDRAALDDETRLDIDVARERQLINAGVACDTPVLVTNLQKVFKDFVALRDMSFHIPFYENKGCVFALLGPNGAAKTTTLHMMVGLLEQTKGKVYLHGYDMSEPKQAHEVYKHIGLCTQFDVFLPNLTVRQHLKLFAAIHGVIWADIDQVVNNLAKFVHLGEVLDKVVNQLSGGMKRRMSLALALIG